MCSQIALELQSGRLLIDLRFGNDSDIWALNLFQCTPLPWIVESLDVIEYIGPRTDAHRSLAAPVGFPAHPHRHHGPTAGLPVSSDGSHV